MLRHCSRVQLFVTLWTAAHQAPPSMGFSRQEYWSGLPFPSPGVFPTQGWNPCLMPPHWQVGSLPVGPAGRPCRGSCHQINGRQSLKGCGPTCPSLPGPQPSPGPPHASSSSPKACFPSSGAEPSLILSQQRPFPVLPGRLSHPRVKLNAFDAIFQYNWEHFERKLD